MIIKKIDDYTQIGTLEEQLDYVSKTNELYNDCVKKFKRIETLSETLDQLLITDNEYTEHNLLSLFQIMQEISNIIEYTKCILEQQIKMKNGISEEKLREFSLMFKHFDEKRSAKLDHQKFISCLRALGYDIPIVEKK